MGFKDAGQVWRTVSIMLQAEQPRSRNRARIDAVFNGNPPYTDEEANDNRIETNVNFLDGTRIINGARQVFTNAFQKPDNYFTVTLDIGPKQKRQQWGKIITREMNRVMKRSTKYDATLESQFAGTVLHGIVRDEPVTARRRGVAYCRSAVRVTSSPADSSNANRESGSSGGDSCRGRASGEARTSYERPLRTPEPMRLDR